MATLVRFGRRTAALPSRSAGVHRLGRAAARPSTCGPLAPVRPARAIIAAFVDRPAIRRVPRTASAPDPQPPRVHRFGAHDRRGRRARTSTGLPTGGASLQDGPSPLKQAAIARRIVPTCVDAPCRRPSSVSGRIDAPERLDRQCRSAACAGPPRPSRPPLNSFSQMTPSFCGDCRCSNDRIRPRRSASASNTLSTPSTSPGNCDASRSR